MKNSTNSNQYNLDGDYGILTIGKHQVLFDKEDYKKISSKHWVINDDGEGFIRVRHIYKDAEGRKHYEPMHMFLGYKMNTSRKNGNNLDVRKDNLIMCTRQQLSYLSKAPKNSVSGIKGVTRVKGKNLWKATICYHGDSNNLGTYENKSDAVRARLIAESIYCHGFISPEQKFLHKVILNEQ